jgi:hypothetical protein
MTGLDTQSALIRNRPPRPTSGVGRSVPTRKAAFWVFVAAEALIFAALVWNFHGRWFVADEWTFLAGRTVDNLNSLFSPYNVHWSTLPILYYQLLWNLVGIRSYLPYLVSILVLHITVCALLRAVMIRANVLPWIATLSAIGFCLYGAGYADISYAFDIGFDGSIVFGLLFLLATDHAGPLDRRDLLGVVAGLAALMCSGIGVSMVAAVAIAVWIRNGLRRALVVALPLAVAYVLWFIAIGHGAYSSHSGLSDAVRFAFRGLAFTFSSLGHSPFVGGALVALLVVGIVLTVRTSGSGELRARYGVPGGLLAGAVVFMVITGFGRATNSLPSSDTYAASRYLYVVAALLIPAIAVAASQVITRWWRAWPVVVVVLVLGVPGNIAVMHRNNYLHTLDGYRQFFLSLPRLPVATHLPPSIHPDPYYDSAVTMGWLLAGVRSGRIPPPSPAPSPAQAALWTLQLALRRGTAAPSGTCQTLVLPGVTRVQVGARVTVDAPVNVSYLSTPDRASATVRLPDIGTSATYVSSWPMELRITPTSPGQTAEVCAAPS